MDILKTIGDIAAILVLVGGIIAFIFKESIKAYFARDLLDKKSGIDKDLEDHKKLIIKNLEDYKLGIDVRRNLATEVSKKRLDAYQSTMTTFYRFYGEVDAYSKDPSMLNKDKSFSGPQGKERIDAFTEQMFYFSNPALKQFNKEFMPIFTQVLDKVAHIKPISKEELDGYLKKLNSMRAFLLSEVFPDDPTVKEIQ